MKKKYFSYSSIKNNRVSLRIPKNKNISYTLSRCINLSFSVKIFPTLTICEEEQEKVVHCKTFIRNCNKIPKHKMENIKHEMKNILPHSF